jgi:xanthine dehydrogenase small subunit
MTAASPPPVSVAFTCNGEPVEVEAAEGESLLSVLRERLAIRSAKDGCAPQGQCGCCTVLVDGTPRVACVTPVTRVGGRSVTTIEGLPEQLRDALAEAFAATGGSQCGFCTPGILLRAVPLVTAEPPTAGDRAAVDRALAAHLCRCTGWQTIHEAIAAAPAHLGGAQVRPRPSSGAEAAGGGAGRATLEGGVAQRVGPEIALGAGGFADDTAPAGALVAVPLPPVAEPVAVDVLEAGGLRFVVGETLAEARARAAKVQGRRTTVGARPPLPPPAAPAGGVALATSWVEPAYLEPDASWCLPGGEPATPLANGGAFGAKVGSPAPAAARALADRLGRPVRVMFSREDVVRLGPKRPPVAATARVDGSRVVIEGCVVGDPGWMPAASPCPYDLRLDATWSAAEVPGPRTAAHLRAVGLAETAVLVEGAIDAAGLDRSALAVDGRARAVLLDACVRVEGGATAGAAVDLATDGTVAHVRLRVVAGDPLDAVVLRSYAIGATHMALGWVLSEAIAVDPTTGDVLDLTVRSFGILRSAQMPPVDVAIVDDAGPARPRASDAVFAAVAAATWNALARHRGVRPATFPAGLAPR